MEHHKYKLVRVNGIKNEEYILHAGETKLGRHEDSNIYFESKTVSRWHCEFVTKNDTVTVTDLKSSNGVYINGNLTVPNRPTVLFLNDYIGIGSGLTTLCTMNDIVFQLKENINMNLKRELDDGDESCHKKMKTEVEVPRVEVPIVEVIDLSDDENVSQNQPSIMGKENGLPPTNVNESSTKSPESRPTIPVLNGNLNNKNQDLNKTVKKELIDRSNLNKSANSEGHNNDKPHQVNQPDYTDEIVIVDKNSNSKLINLNNTNDSSIISKTLSGTNAVQPNNINTTSDIEKTHQESNKEAVATTVLSVSGKSEALLEINRQYNNDNDVDEDDDDDNGGQNASMVTSKDSDPDPINDNEGSQGSQSSQYSKYDVITLSDDEDDNQKLADLMAVEQCQIVFKEERQLLSDIDADLESYYTEETTDTNDERFPDDNDDDDDDPEEILITNNWINKLSRNKLRSSHDFIQSPEISSGTTSGNESHTDKSQSKRNERDKKKSDKDSDKRISKEKLKTISDYKRHRSNNHSNIGSSSHRSSSSHIRSSDSNRKNTNKSDNLIGKEKDKYDKKSVSKRKSNSINENHIEESTNSYFDRDSDDMSNNIFEPSTSSRRDSTDRNPKKIKVIEPRSIQRRRSSNIPSSIETEESSKANQKSPPSSLFAFDKPKRISSSRRRSSCKDKEKILHRVQERLTNLNGVRPAPGSSSDHYKKLKHDRAERLKQVEDKKAESKQTDKAENQSRVHKPRAKVTNENRGFFLLPENIKRIDDEKSKSNQQSNKHSRTKSLKESPQKTKTTSNNKLPNKDCDKRISKDKTVAKKIENVDQDMNNINVSSINTTASYLNLKNSIPLVSNEDISSANLEEDLTKCNISIPKKLPSNIKPIGSFKKLEETVDNDKKRVSFSSQVQCKEYNIDEGNRLSKKCFGKVNNGIVPKLDSFLSQVLSWSPKWLEEQKNNSIAPPLHKHDFNYLPLLKSYLNFDEYYNIMAPLMGLEIWAVITKSSEEISQNPKGKMDIGGSIVANSVSKQSIPGSNNYLTSFFVQTLANEGTKQYYPTLGDLVTMEVTFRNKLSIRIFCYIHQINEVPLRQTTSYNSDLKHHCVHPTLLITYEMKTGEFFDLGIVTNKVSKIKFLTYLRSNLRMIQAIQYLPSSPLLKRILQPKLEDYSLPILPINNYELKTKEKLNLKQMESILRITHAVETQDSHISLIQGPPGTGKSRVIVNLVTQILMNNQKDNIEKKRILLCAPSNAAIDELGKRLLDIRSKFKEKKDRFKMVRIGRPEVINKTVLDVSLTTLAKRQEKVLLEEWDFKNNMSKDEFEREKNFITARQHAVQVNLEAPRVKNSGKKILNMIEDDELKIQLKYLHAKYEGKDMRESKLLYNVEKTILAGADIIICTLSTCYTKIMEELFGPNKIKISVCIIDEATQTTEAESLIPLMLGVKNFVLVGDPNQLPATVIDLKAKRLGLDQSLFARLQKNFDESNINPIIVLDTQYRMANPISKWPNDYFYNGILKNSSVMHKLPFHFYRVLNLKAVQNSNCFTNYNEAKFVVNIIYTIMTVPISSQLDKIRVGVITPYRDQLKVINDELIGRMSHVDQKTRSKFDIEVNTIDSYQGQERDVIIISCVRSSGIGFLNDRQRICVALTRAKHSLFICGNFRTFESCEMWQELLKDARQRNVFYNVDYNIDSAQLKRFIIS